MDIDQTASGLSVTFFFVMQPGVGGWASQKQEESFQPLKQPPLAEKAWALCSWSWGMWAVLLFCVQVL